MISVSDALNEIIQSHPLIENGLAAGIINYSAFAREVKPKIEKRLYKSVTTGAIVMALKRLSSRLAKNKPKNKEGFNLTDLTVRSNLVEFTFQNSQSLINKQRELFDKLAVEKDVFCAVSQGIRETTYIASSKMITAIERIFSDETLIDKKINLSSITTRLPEETANTPGVYYQILKMLAWENINVTEIISTYTELTIVFDDKDIDRAFSNLKNLSNPS